MLQDVALGERSLADYTHLAGRGLVERIRELAEPLAGKRVLHVSATAFGGGVSEILYSMVPLMRDVGIDAGDDRPRHHPRPKSPRCSRAEREFQPRSILRARILRTRVAAPKDWKA